MVYMLSLAEGLAYVMIDEEFNMVVYHTFLSFKYFLSNDCSVVACTNTASIDMSSHFCNELKLTKQTKSVDVSSNTCNEFSVREFIVLNL